MSALPSAMFTKVSSSSMVTSWDRSQSPTHALLVGVWVGATVGRSVTVPVSVAAGVAVAVDVVVAVGAAVPVLLDAGVGVVVGASIDVGEWVAVGPGVDAPSSNAPASQARPI